MCVTGFSVAQLECRRWPGLRAGCAASSCEGRTNIPALCARVAQKSAHPDYLLQMLHLELKKGPGEILRNIEPPAALFPPRGADLRHTGAAVHQGKYSGIDCIAVTVKSCRAATFTNGNDSYKTSKQVYVRLMIKSL